jgi:predicted nucleic acid-binding protein
MTAENVFVDTNIWIYALVKSDTPGEREKHLASLTLFEKLVSENRIVVSTQILNECHWNLVRKFRYDDKEVFQRIEQNIIEIATVLDLSLQTYLNSFRIREQFKYSFWDSLVLASAMDGECLTLYSEDFQHGQKLGDITVSNPFIELET